MANRDEPIRVLVVDDMADTRDSLEKLLSFEDDIVVAGSATDGKDAVDQARDLLPDIVLMDINMPTMDGIQAAEIISSEFPTCQVIMMSVQGDSEYLRRSMLAGAREFLVKPFTGDELAATIRHVFELQASLRVAEPEPVEAMSPLEVEAMPLISDGELIMVYSPRGGVGVTTIACNLAVALATAGEGGRGRVALVDLDPHFGDVGLAMDIESNTNLYDITGYGTRFDTDVLNGLMVEHVSGVEVLLGPPRPGLPPISLDYLTTVFDKLRVTRSFTVVDNPAGFSDNIYALMERASRVLLVLTLDMPSIKDAKLFLQLARGGGFLQRVVTVVNRADDSSEITISEVEGILGRKVDHVLSAHPRLATFALNRGVPFTLSTREAPLSREIEKLATALQARPGQAAKAPDSDALPTGMPLTRKKSGGGLLGFLKPPMKKRSRSGPFAEGLS